MPAMTSGIPTCPDAAERPRRLAAQLADMIPGTVTIRVSLADPTKQWPAPRARAFDAAGNPIELNRTAAVAAARWMLRVWPDQDWTRPHVLDLATATLTSSGPDTTGLGG